MTIKGGKAPTVRDETSAPSRAEAGLNRVGSACLVAAMLCALGVLLAVTSAAEPAAKSYQLAVSLAACLTALVSAAWAFGGAQALTYLRRADERAQTVALAAVQEEAPPPKPLARTAPAPRPEPAPRAFR